MLALDQLDKQVAPPRVMLFISFKIVCLLAGSPKVFMMEIKLQKHVKITQRIPR
jgi:hypothetical protein